MVKPSPTFSRLTVAVVSSFCAVKPAPPSCAESAIVKHPACAAASSSSGLVPTPFSKRVLKEYCVCLRTPLSVEMEPLPLFKSPCQTALALRCMVLSFMHSCYLESRERGRYFARNMLRGVLRGAVPPRPVAILGHLRILRDLVQSADPERDIDVE